MGAVVAFVVYQWGIGCGFAPKACAILPGAGVRGPSVKVRLLLPLLVGTAGCVFSRLSCHGPSGGLLRVGPSDHVLYSVVAFCFDLWYPVAFSSPWSVVCYPVSVSGVPWWPSLS